MDECVNDLNDPMILLAMSQEAGDAANPSVADLLHALDWAARAHGLLDTALVEAIAEHRTAREAAEDLGEILGQKSEEQERLEERKRAAKRLMTHLLDRLCDGHMYREYDIIRAASEAWQPTDGDPAPRAIATADLEGALGSLENRYARRAFWMRYRGGLSDHIIAQQLGTTAESVPRLCNIALRHVDLYLNVPVVADVRARFWTYCLDHGLEFPDYERIRGR